MKLSSEFDHGLTIPGPRADLLRIYRAALDAVHGRSRVREALSRRLLSGRFHAVAIGKAAVAMMEGAQDALGANLSAGLVITKDAHAGVQGLFPARITILTSAHPVPDGRSLAAGKALLEFVAAVPPGACLLILISGGASSLVEVLPEHLTLEDLRRANQWLLSCGWDIRRINALRKRLSCIKGGKLASFVRCKSVVQLLISDVPGDDPQDIGSGLLVPGRDAEIALHEVPSWLGRMLTQQCLQKPQPDAGIYEMIETSIIASLDVAMNAAAVQAQKMGYTACLHHEHLRGDAADAGRNLARDIMNAGHGVHIWGGETTMVLPDAPGRGGRCQHLALAAARELRGHEHAWLLAAGTDGSDGPGSDAGALVDGGTILRGELETYDAEDCLKRADAGTFLEASGDLVCTGPTGTNVMDIVIGLKQ